MLLYSAFRRNQFLISVEGGKIPPQACLKDHTDSTQDARSKGKQVFNSLQCSPLCSGGLLSRPRARRPCWGWTQGPGIQASGAYRDSWCSVKHVESSSSPLPPTKIKNSLKEEVQGRGACLQECISEVCLSLMVFGHTIPKPQ